MPISRHGLTSETVGGNIYLIGGGVIPGFSSSKIVEKYHNTIIPEFGILVSIILAISVGMIIIFSKNKFKII
jgi:predicted secreted protein with PEFG-CTERM motif